MKIESIDIQNTLGARRVQVDLSQAITLFAGNNGAGKSSVAESVRMALGDDPIRVALKKDYSALVTEGQKKGRVIVATDTTEYTITLPDGKRNWTGEQDLPIPFLLDPSRFAALSADDRRNFLFALTGLSVSAVKVRDLMLKRGCDEDLTEKVLPIVQSSFPAACDFAKGQARDEKSVWKGVTGETYGEKKAEDWHADVPNFDAKRADAIGIEIESLQGRIEESAQNVGALREKFNVHARWLSAAAARQDDVKRLPGLRTKIESNEAELENWKSEVQRLEGAAGKGPRTGLVHDLARALNWMIESAEPTPNASDEDRAAIAALDAYESEYGPVGGQCDPEAAERLPRAIEARDLMQRIVENTRRDISRIEAIERVEQEPESVSGEAIEQVEQDLTKLRANLLELESERQRLGTISHAAKVAAQATEKAAIHHTNVLAWLQIADTLAPEGIPSELLSHALGPINDRLRTSATATGWMQVAIGADISITAAGRAYPLLSASEKWRTDAMLAEAISHLSGIRLLVLDEMDILEVSARGTLMSWLNSLAETRELETALVFATLKNAPAGLPDSIGSYWIENGIVETLETAAA